MKWFAALVVFLVSSSTAAGVARADDISFTYSAELTFVTSYVWRGQRLSTDAMEPLAQPFVELGLDPLGPGTLTAGVWSSRALTEKEANQEFDAYISYAVPVGPLALKGGYIVYVLPSEDPADAMHEFSLQAATRWELPVTLAAGLAVDPIRTDGWYAFGGASHSFGLAGGSLDTSLNVGGSDYAGMDRSLQDVTATARASHPIGGSGAYVAMTASSAWSGRDEELYYFAGLGVGVTR